MLEAAIKEGPKAVKQAVKQLSETDTALPAASSLTYLCQAIDELAEGQEYQALVTVAIQALVPLLADSLKSREQYINSLRKQLADGWDILTCEVSI